LALLNIDKENKEIIIHFESFIKPMRPFINKAGILAIVGRSSCAVVLNKWEGYTPVLLVECFEKDSPVFEAKSYTAQSLIVYFRSFLGL